MHEILRAAGNNELAEALNILLASLSERSGDTSPALRFTCGRSP